MDTQVYDSTPAVEQGIFSDDIAITFRNVMQLLLDSYLHTCLSIAKTEAARHGVAIRDQYARGVRSVDKWGTIMRKVYRAGVVATHARIADMYGHVAILYCRAMYHDAHNTVQIDMTVPPLSTLLHTFLRIAADKDDIVQGPYLTYKHRDKVLMVENLIRETLYQLLVINKNIKGVQEINDVNDAFNTVADMPNVVSEPVGIGIPARQPTRPPAPQPSQMASHVHRPGFPEPPTPYRPKHPTPHPVGPAAAAAAAVAVGGGIAAGTTAIPSVHSSALDIGFFDDPTPDPASVPGTPQRKSQVLETPASEAPASEAPASEAPASEAPASEAPTLFAEPVVTEPVATEPVVVPNPAIPPVIPSDLFSVISARPTGKPRKQEPEPIFDVLDKFTARRPAGERLPLPIPVGSDNPNGLDTYDLQPSETDYADEVRRILEDATTATISPFDSVSHAGRGALRPPPPPIPQT